MEMRKLGYSNGQYAEDAQKPILLNYPTDASVKQALSREVDDEQNDASEEGLEESSSSEDEESESSPSSEDEESEGEEKFVACLAWDGDNPVDPESSEQQWTAFTCKQALAEATGMKTAHIERVLRQPFASPNVRRVAGGGHWSKKQGYFVLPLEQCPGLVKRMEDRENEFVRQAVEADDEGATETLDEMRVRNHLKIKAWQLANFQGVRKAEKEGAYRYVSEAMSSIFDELTNTG